MRNQQSLHLVLSFILVGIFFSCTMKESKQNPVLFVGTYTNNGSEGIYKFNFNTETGELTNMTLAAAIENPSYLTISPDKRTLYAVGEVDDYVPNSGAITTYRIKDTILEKVNSKPTYGENPCFVGVSANGSVVAVANYTGGNISVFTAQNNGDLQDGPQVLDHKDTNITPHPHKASFLNGELFVSDLGMDKVYKYSNTDGKFLPSQQPSLSLAEGAGPRHFSFSADGKFLYVINELNSTITIFKEEDGKYNAKQTVKTTSEDFSGESFCADIHISPDGKFLYGSNRGENTIVIFRINAETGLLELMGREAVKGDWPRNFSLDPSGDFLLVANQRSNNIVVFKRNLDKGTLSFKNEVNLPSPVCLQFF